jgi:diguanylate cyclase (GGDEF)-like protein/PAS domain S-box-containing protein
MTFVRRELSTGIRPASFWTGFYPYAPEVWPNARYTPDPDCIFSLQGTHTAPGEREIVDNSDSASPSFHDGPSAGNGVADVAGRGAGLEPAFDPVLVGIGVLDLEGHTTSTNEVLRDSLGYSSEEFAATAFRAFIHPDDLAAHMDRFARLAGGGSDRFAIDERFVRRDGGTLWVAHTVSLVRDAEGNPHHAISVTQDAIGHRQSQRDPGAVEQRSQLQVERVPAIVYVAEPGPHGRWLYVSPQIESILGFTARQWMADPGLWMQLLHPHDQQSKRLAGSALAEEADLLIQSNEDKAYSDTYRLLHRNGSTVWVRDDAMLLWDAAGHATWHGVMVDVTREKLLEERLEHQALHDPLTGLPNRKLFRDRVGQALRRHPSRQIAVLFIDLDNFKTVNDSFGHACGDEVIAAAARRLQGCARDGDTAARVGGDEFALLVEDVTPGQVTALADRVISALTRIPVDFSRRTLTIGASVGIAIAGAHETTETLLRDADLAMYEAKLQGRGRHVLYKPTMRTTAMNRFRLREALQTALADGLISLAYQPIVDLSTGAVPGLEALARWTDSQLGNVSPAEFIQVAEDTGLIHELGHWVTERACADLAQWRSSRGVEVYVSVNVSPLQLDNDGFASWIMQSLKGHDLPPSALVLEVTEGVLLVERGRQTLRELRAHGVRVAIDDFGTGYSSLSHLRQLPVDMVKIDQAFLHPREDNTEDSEFLPAIIRLAETLSLVSICEGIETPDQLLDVQASGCGYGQGDFLAMPGPASDVPAAIELVGRGPAGTGLEVGVPYPGAVDLADLSEFLGVT